MSPTSGVDHNCTPGSKATELAVPTATNAEQIDTKVQSPPLKVSDTKKAEKMDIHATAPKVSESKKPEDMAISDFPPLDPVPRFGSPSIYDYDESPPPEPPTQVANATPAQVKKAPPEKSPHHDEPGSPNPNKTVKFSGAPSTLNAINTTTKPVAAAYHSNFVRYFVVKFEYISEMTKTNKLSFSLYHTESKNRNKNSVRETIRSIFKPDDV